MTKNDVLIVNSYAGSLTIAANDLGLRIRGSYEDAGFGIKIQKANFPQLNYVDHCPWPKQDLTGVNLIAHPPCSAFSVQTAANVKIHGHAENDIRGLTSDAFACTVRILKYGMENNAENIAIESVMGAMDGARQVHDRYAKRYGYNVFRILQNAATFGVPQWRERFWCIFSRSSKYAITYKPVIKRAKQIFKNDGGADHEAFGRYVQTLRGMGYAKRKIDGLFAGELGYGPIDKTLGIRGQIIRGQVSKRINGPFQTSVLRVLDPDGFVPVMQHDHVWIWDGQIMSDANYKRAMGFPANYDMLARSSLKMYLTKGTCPPVAQWILGGHSGGARHMIEPNGLLDLRVKRSDPAQLRSEL